MNHELTDNLEMSPPYARVNNIILTLKFEYDYEKTATSLTATVNNEQSI